MAVSELSRSNWGELKLQIKNNELQFYQFYNSHKKPTDFELVKLLTEYKLYPGVNPVINTTVYDIEVTEGDLAGVFPDPQKAAYPVDTIVLYNNITNTSYSLIRILPSHIRKLKCSMGELPYMINKYCKKKYLEMCEENEGYRVKDIKFKTEVFSNDHDLMKRFWKLNQELETLVLTGFNSKGFDDPYIFNRSQQLFSRGLAKTMSRYGDLSSYGQGKFSVPDFSLVDVLYLYKPVDSGGMGMGKPQLSYKLDHLSENILGINKLDLPGGFYENYSNNLLDFVLYNILDVVLTYKLGDYLGFIESLRGMANQGNAAFDSMSTGKSLAFLESDILEFYQQKKILRHSLFNKDIQR